MAAEEGQDIAALTEFVARCEERIESVEVATALGNIDQHRLEAGQDNGGVARVRHYAP